MVKVTFGVPKASIRDILIKNCKNAPKTKLRRKKEKDKEISFDYKKKNKTKKRCTKRRKISIEEGNNVSLPCFSAQKRCNVIFSVEKSIEMIEDFVKESEPRHFKCKVIFPDEKSIEMMEDFVQEKSETNGPEANNSDEETSGFWNFPCCVS